MMGGLRCGNINSINSKYICYTCNLLLRDPIQLYCGHRYCQTCINPEEMVIECMQCHAKTMKNNMFLDRGMKNDMKKLNICCYICYWIGIFENYHYHLTQNHANTSVNQSIVHNAVFQTRQISKFIDNYSKRVRPFLFTTKRIVSQLTTDQLSIEEQNLVQSQESFTSYDGTLCWKIDRVESRINESSGSILTSPPFYTSIDGYKMCVRLDLNGKSLDQSTHLSIFLIIMRGDFDCLLEWPFNHQVIFCLYNRTNNKNHIIESFQSNTKSKSFQRPQTEMNIGSGISKFLPISMFLQENNPYMYDGSIYIKIMVLKEFLPKLILLKIMNIDLAWPIHIQQKIIQQEIEKYKIQQPKLILTLKFR